MLGIMFENILTRNDYWANITVKYPKRNRKVSNMRSTGLDSSEAGMAMFVSLPSGVTCAMPGVAILARDCRTATGFMGHDTEQESVL
jgi:hypothetical protein